MVHTAQNHLLVTQQQAARVDHAFPRLGTFTSLISVIVFCCWFTRGQLYEGTTLRERDSVCEPC